MPERDVSVVITAFTEERWEDFCAAVVSVRAQLLTPREIIVVSDHNRPLAERVEREMPDLRVLENLTARGVTGSRNVAVQAASGQIIAFLDDDAEAEPDWLTRLLAPYDDPRVIGVGGALEPRWMSGRPSWFPEEFNWVVGCTYRGMPTRASPVRNFIGANMSFRREVFEEVRFNTAIGHVGHRTIGGSDPDFCIRVGRRWPDRVMWYEPAALVHHRAHAARGRWRYFRSRCYSEGLSKAILRRQLGARALTSEGRYTTRTLPAGVVCGLRDAVRGDLSGLVRAGAIVAGLAFTTTGFLVGSVVQRTTISD
jgi:glycosyltransferase involved in cell wall biosynthesis